MKQSPQTIVHRVALVVDREYGAKLLNLVNRMHVWVIDSPTNRMIAEQLWEQEPERTSQNRREYGVTLFEAAMNRTPRKAIGDILDTLIEHHSEWEHDPPISELEIHGVHWDRDFESALANLGLQVIAQDASSIVCSLS